MFLLVTSPTAAWSQTDAIRLSPSYPPSAKLFSTNLRGFGIPFRIDPNDPTFIEVQLYLSEDQGRTWRFHDRQTTDKSEFPFTADKDGEYWFALKTLNRNRQLIPDGQAQAELVILVDTVKPTLDFQIESDPAGRVAIRWRAFDKYLDPNTLQILYQPISAGAPEGIVNSNAENGGWIKVPVNLSGTARNGLYVDQVAWWPETTERSLNVRVAIADSAGNFVQQDRRINIAPSPWRHRSSNTARTGDANSSGQLISSSALGFNPNPNGTPPPSNPNQHPTINQTTAYPSNVICENGVCRIGPPLPSTNQTPTQPSGANQNQPNGFPRTAGYSDPYARNLQVPLIGGTPEYAAPPLPTGYRANQTDQTNRSTANDLAQLSGVNQRFSDRSPTTGNAVPWTSEPERWTSRNQTSSSTTMRPDPTILPEQAAQPRNDQNLPAPNPHTLKKIGNQVVGESSTAGPNQNQYQGLGPRDQSSVNQPRRNPFVSGEVIPELANADQQNWSNDSQPPTTSPPTAQVAARPTIPTPRQPINNATAATNFNYANAEEDSSLMMIGSKRFRLNYGIDAIDPSGVAKVDLWMTRDGGRTWNNWGNDPDNTSPFPVEVTEEGRYGFRIVVHSKDGLTGRGPSSGDSADIWVHVDTQSPLAQIVSVPYGRGEEAGRLVVNYRVADPFLVLRPINIAYARNPDGPWTVIGEGVRNEGRYVWKPESNVPDRIFLRLEARDRAGNVGVHQLSQAIDVSGLVPRGTIHGVVPVGQ